jgi:multiple sugar transport system permease protein
MLSTSFKSSAEIYSGSFSWLPKSLEFSNYLVALEKINFGKTLFNTLYIAIFNIFFVVVSSAAAAYAFAVLEWRWRDSFFAITIASMMLPDMALLIPQFLLFKKLNLYGGFMPLIAIYLGGLPFYIFLFRQFFITIPKDLADSARVDGASEFTIWRAIYLPLARPIIMVVALLQFLISWNDLIKPSIYLIDEKQYTISLALQQYQAQHGGAEWGPLMAASIIMVIPIIILFLFTQKTFVRGVVGSGLKE